MGVIKRQGSKHTAVRIASVALGAMASLFIYPMNLSTYGMLVFLLSLSTFLVYPLTLGFGQTMIKFYHEFVSEDKKSNFFFTQSIIQGLILMITCSVFYFLQEYVLLALKRLNFDIEIIQSNKKILISLVVIVAFRFLWLAYTQTIRRIVVPELLYNILYKIGLPLLIVLSTYKLFDLVQVKWLFLLLLLFINAFLLVYIITLKKSLFRWDFSQYKKNTIRRMADFSIFGMFTSLGGQLAFRIDNIMVAPLIGVESNGIYSIMMFMASTLIIPMISIDLISHPIISKAMVSGDKIEVNKIYKRGSNIFGTLGIVLFFLIWIHLPIYFNLSEKTQALQSGSSVFLWLGLSKIFDCLTSINGSIIKFSKYFRFNLFTTLALGCMNIWLNLQLIPIYGLEGVAIATAISLAIFNAIKLIFVWKVLGYHPFRRDTVLVVVLFCFCLLLNHLLSPFTDNFYLRLGLNYGLFLMVLIFPIYKYNLAPDLREMLLQSLNKFWKRKNI